MSRRAARLWLIFLAIVFGQALLCIAARGEEIARVEVSRPATVRVERDPDGTVRLVVEYRPDAPAPTPTPQPTPAPEPAPGGIEATVKRQLGSIGPLDRRAVIEAFAAPLGAAIVWAHQNNFRDGTEAGNWIADRVLLSLGASGQQHQAAILRATASLAGPAQGLAGRIERFRVAVEASR